MRLAKEKNSGLQFKPEVVQALKSVLEKEMGKDAFDFLWFVAVGLIRREA